MQTVNNRVWKAYFLPFYWCLLAILLFVLLCVQAPVQAGEENTAWTVYYHNQLRPEAFDPYSLVVLDSTEHPPVWPMRAAGKSVLGYISLGEVADYRHWYSAVAKEGLLLRENPFWPGSHWVDLRDPRWTKRVVSELIPAILRQGFSGIFLDTLDNAAALEQMDPVTYAGMEQAAIQLVRTIRRHYPEIKIMLNRGYTLLPHLGDVIDSVLGESVFSTYDHQLKRYNFVNPDAYAQQVSTLQQAAKQFPNLTVYSLDYWAPDDTKVIQRIYKTERANGFIPYVATIGLDRIVSEPTD